ncbi:hypothetical protein [Inconstantimicrobium mannanitabidum]|uniref:Uncharacterized protein n=1 Tax=Inconstantimicrobium mannanitabidum TaxID=1604901 RepID=A0ACB5RD21_9CLOT|nr:hypothetical protein [Clostridium sp. TW13]GKX66661.1 hypothetical protein rsdtw13_19190 [Clostridium sp. TW13]
MDLIDLRKFDFDMFEVVSENDSELIFQGIELENGIYKSYVYIYYFTNKCVERINKVGIETAECGLHDNCILNNYLYTCLTKANSEGKEMYIYRISLTDGGIENLYCITKNAFVNILSDRYVLVNGNDYKIDKEHSDLEKELKGEYDYAILCDLEGKKEYKINDIRIASGIRDYFIPYSVDGSRYVVFEEAYMYDVELQEIFEKGIGKEDFYRNGYRESINIISLSKFAESVKSGCNVIPFKEIHKTELNAWTRYFGMDDENIYYRVMNFETKIEQIFLVDKRNFEKRILKSVKSDTDSSSYSYYNLCHNIKNKEIYEIIVVNKNKYIIKGIYKNSYNIVLDDVRESFQGVVGDYIITEFWTEDDNGDNYKDFVKIKNTKDNSVSIYEGTCTIIKDKLVLFKYL